MNEVRKFAAALLSDNPLALLALAYAEATLTTPTSHSPMLDNIFGNRRQRNLTHKRWEQHLHGITSTDPGSGATPLGASRFIDKYVFPCGELPHISLALKEMQVGGLEVLDVECLRRHYEKTLKLWSQNYEKHAASIRAQVDKTTFRVWRIYLAGCAHAFAENWISLNQVLACKSGAEKKLNPPPWSRAFMYR